EMLLDDETRGARRDRASLSAEERRSAGFGDGRERGPVAQNAGRGAWKWQAHPLKSVGIRHIVWHLLSPPASRNVGRAHQHVASSAVHFEDAEHIGLFIVHGYRGFETDLLRFGDRLSDDQLDVGGGQSVIRRKS